MDQRSSLITASFMALLVAFLSYLMPVSTATEFTMYNPAKPPPIDPAIILYLSDHLTSPECYKFVNFLISQTEGDRETTKEKIWKLAGDDPVTFSCHKALKFWHEEYLSVRLPNPADEETEIAQGLLMLASNYVQRNDINKWFKKLRNDRVKAQVRALKKEMARHRLEGLAQEKENSAGDNARTKMDEVKAKAAAAAVRSGGFTGSEEDEEAEAKRKVLLDKVYIVTGTVAVIVILILIIVSIGRRYKNSRKSRAYIFLDNNAGSGVSGGQGRSLYSSSDPDEQTEWSL